MTIRCESTLVRVIRQNNQILKDRAEKAELKLAIAVAALTKIAAYSDGDSGVCPGRGCDSPREAANALRQIKS